MFKLLGILVSIYLHGLLLSGRLCTRGGFAIEAGCRVKESRVLGYCTLGTSQ